VRDKSLSNLLSRWNAEDFTVLRKDNISALSVGISPQQLPKTFADAVTISRKLEVDYLWIDSLCIVQDDEADWRREMTLMEHVYGGSYLNIAASSAASVHGGCWVANRVMQSAFRTKVRVGDRELVREIRDDECYDVAVWKSHLATRAWALQEKLLPSRTIHLGDRGAFWECRHKIANEYLPDGFTKRLGSGLLQKMRKLQFLQQWWARVVHLYTSANLTFARDKLPALSGIARRIHSQKGGQYLAGLWRDEKIEAQLCWRVQEPRTRPTAWRAPSWSWASVDGSISYTPTQEGICDDHYAHVVDANVTPLAGDIFGELSAGTLHIACTSIILGELTGRDKLVVQGVDEKFECPVSLDALDEDLLSSDATVYILPLIGGKQGMRWRDKGEVEWREPKVIQGIVLRRAGSNAGVFRRVGTFKCEESRMEENASDGNLASQRYHEFMRELERSGAEVARLVCAKVVENAERPAEIFAITLV
jgi:hypothetical protein